MTARPVIEELKIKFQELIAADNLADIPVRVAIGTLTTKQAIGDPGRTDYPLLEGKEVMIEARVRDAFGQAFTSKPHEFSGHVRDVLDFNPAAADERAVFIATLNAVMAAQGRITGTRHCRDEEPEQCAAEMAGYLRDRLGDGKIGLIGLQPAILDHLVRTFGGDNVRCTDLAVKNIGTVKYGAEIWDGGTDTERLIDWADTVLATSSTIVNGTFDGIRESARQKEKRLIIFGVTGAGAASLLGVERLCFRPH